MLRTHLSHPLFSDFKHVKLDLDLAICFPCGAGGNFLSSLTGNRLSSLDNVNEFIVRGVYDGNCLEPEDFVDTESGAPEPIIDLYNLHVRAAHDSVTTNWLVNPKQMLSHLPPMFTHHVYDMQLNEIVFVEVDLKTAWIPKLLHSYKKWLNANYQEKPLLMAGLLSNIDYNGPIKWMDYLSMLKSINNNVPDLGLSHTPLAWRWYMHCMKRGKDYTDFELFRRYAGSMIWDEFISTHDQQPTQWARIHVSDYYRGSRDYMLANVPNSTVISYDQLFIDVNTPPTGVLSTLDRSAIVNYSRSNLTALRSMSVLLTGDYRSAVDAELDSMQARLDSVRI